MSHGSLQSYGWRKPNTLVLNSGPFRQCCVSGYGSARICIDVGLLDPDEGGQKWLTKKEKGEKIYCFEELDVLFRELDVFCEGLGINKFEFFLKKHEFLQFTISGYQIPGSGSISLWTKLLDLDSIRICIETIADSQHCLMFNEMEFNFSFI